MDEAHETALIANAFERSFQSSELMAQAEKERENSPIDPKTGFHLKTREMRMDEDVDRVNPGYSIFDSERSNNCALCTVTLEMRRRGYEVQAKPDSKGRPCDWLSTVFDAETRLIEGSAVTRRDLDRLSKTGANLELVRKTKQQLLSYGDGARGGIGIIYKNAGGTGHSVYFTVEKGEIKIIDAQAAIQYLSSDGTVDLFLNRGAAFYTTRFDNAKVKNMDAIKEACK